MSNRELKKKLKEKQKELKTQQKKSLLGVKAKRTIGNTLVYIVLVLISLIWLFPLIARYANTDKAMLKNSLLIGLRYLFCTIMVFAIHFAMFFAVVALFTPLIIFGEGLCALLSSGMMIQVFRIMSYQEEE